MQLEDLIFLIFWIEAGAIWQSDEYHTEQVRHVAKEFNPDAPWESDDEADIDRVDQIENETQERADRILNDLKTLAGVHHGNA